MPELDKDVEQRLELVMVEVSDWFNTDVKVRNTIKQFLAQELAVAKAEGAREATVRFWDSFVSELDKIVEKRTRLHEPLPSAEEKTTLAIRYEAGEQLYRVFKSISQLTNPPVKDKHEIF